MAVLAPMAMANVATVTDVNRGAQIQARPSGGYRRCSENAEGAIKDFSHAIASMARRTSSGARKKRGRSLPSQGPP